MARINKCRSSRWNVKLLELSNNLHGCLYPKSSIRIIGLSCVLVALISEKSQSLSSSLSFLCNQLHNLELSTQSDVYTPIFAPTKSPKWSLELNVNIFMIRICSWNINNCFWISCWNINHCMIRISYWNIDEFMIRTSCCNINKCMIRIRCWNVN